MSYININHFATAMMTYLTERSSIIWRPSLTNLPLLSNEENEHLLSYVATVGRAAEKLSSLTAELNADSFEEMLLHAAPMYDIRVLLDDYIHIYSAFKFIAYMSCLTGFSILCHRNGHESAPDSAVRAIIEIMITHWWYVFSRRRAWEELRGCAQYINRNDFDAPTPYL